MPEAAIEKAISTGTWAVAMVLSTQVGVVPPMTGSPIMVEVPILAAKDLLGGYFIVEPYFEAAYALGVLESVRGQAPVFSQKTSF